MKNKRYLYADLINDLEKKMVFVGGPRQVGKTTLAKKILKQEGPGKYLNWDNPVDRGLILKHEIPLDEKILAFDEIHKYKNWRSTVKGLFDTQREKTSILVTGSARLDYFRKGGDSLVGRYHYYRLHPFSLREVNSKATAKDLQDLLQFGGFPEPFLGQDEKYLRRWQRERVSRVVTQDLRDLETVKETSLVELLVESLPARVGSPLSLRSLGEDLAVSPNTIDRWIGILDNLYISFRIPPFGAPKIRAVKKEKKLYLWEWASISEPGPRFENLVASQLLKFCHFREDTEGYRMELRFIRDTDLREVDFVVLQDRKPLFAVECKTGEGSLSRAIPYFKARTNIPKFYQVHLGTKDFGSATNGRVLPFRTFCDLEDMP